MTSLLKDANTFRVTVYGDGFIIHNIPLVNVIAA